MPVLVDDEGGIIAGHGRVLAARQLGISRIPVMVAKGWSEAQRRAYVIADNQLALNAGWDKELLQVEFGELQELGFDLALTGFELGAISTLLAEPQGGPAEFASYDEGIETEFCCPKCQYKWSGKPS